MDHGDSLAVSSSCWACSSKRPTADIGATVSWHDELMATCKAALLSTDNIGCRLAAVDEALRSNAMQTPMNSHSKLKLDVLRNIQPMELGVKQMCQATVELVSFTYNPSCCS